MEEKETQLELFNLPEWWEEHWQDMPEFNQKDLTPFKSIYVHFKSIDDIEAFSKLIGQKIFLTTQSIWYPEAEIGRTAGKVYTTKGYKKNES